MDTPVVLGNKDIVLVVSLTINICVAMYLFFSVVSAYLMRCTFSTATKDEDGEETNPLGKLRDDREKAVSKHLAIMLTDQVCTWMLITASIMLLIYSSVLTSPMTLTSDFAHSALLHAFLCACLGRYCFLLGLLTMVREDRQNIKELLPKVLTNTLSIACYTMFVYWQENLILGVIGPLMESSQCLVHAATCIKMLRGPERSTTYLLTYALAVITSFLTKFVLPIGFISYTISIQSPLQMSTPSVSIFCFSICFFGFHVLWFNLLYSIKLAGLYCHKQLQQDWEKNAGMMNNRPGAQVASVLSTEVMQVIPDHLEKEPLTDGPQGPGELPVLHRITPAQCTVIHNDLGYHGSGKSPAWTSASQKSHTCSSDSQKLISCTADNDTTASKNTSKMSIRGNVKKSSKAYKSLHKHFPNLDSIPEEQQN